MSEARDRILDRLRANRPHEVSVPPVYQKPLGWDREQCIAEFQRTHAGGARRGAPDRPQ